MQLPPVEFRILSFCNWYIIENLHDIYTFSTSLMKQYGKVFSLRLGSFKVVVAASADSVKEMLVKRSADYAGRPPFHSIMVASLGKNTYMRSKVYVNS